VKNRLLLTLLTLILTTAMLTTGCAQAATTAATTAAAETTAAPAADQSLQKVLDAKTFVLGFDEAFPPMGYLDANNQHVGFDIDLAKEVTKRMGVELKLQPIDWSQKENELNSGNIDCIWNGFSITPERLAAMAFTTPYMKNRQVVIVLADSPVKALADLKGKKLAVQAESSAVEALNKAADFKSSLKEVVELKDNVTALMDLKASGTDALLVDEIVAGYYIAREKKAYRILDEALAEEEFGVGFRKADLTLRDEVQKQLEAMAKDGTLAKISTDWFSKDITTIGK
jgi:polar amino acid transport system substrate-binding protein